MTDAADPNPPAPSEPPESPEPAGPGPADPPLPAEVLPAAPPSAVPVIYPVSRDAREGEEPGPAWVEQQPAPPRRRRLPVWGTALIVIGIAWLGDLGSGVVAGVAGAVLTAMKVPSLEGWPVHPPVLIFASVASWTFCLLAIWLLACKYHGKSLVEGLEMRMPGVLGFSAAVGIGLVMAAVGTVIAAYWGRHDTMIAKMTSTPMGLAVITMLALPMAFAEEIYYRGFLFPKLRDGLRHLVRLGLPGDERIFPALAAAAVIAGWFGLIHLQQLVGKGGVDWASLSVVAFAGMVFTLQRWFSGSLLPSMVTHFVYNGSLISISLILNWLGVEIQR